MFQAHDVQSYGILIFHQNYKKGLVGKMTFVSFSKSMMKKDKSFMVLKKD